jgi:hypothetical protein
MIPTTTMIHPRNVEHESRRKMRRWAWLRGGEGDMWLQGQAVRTTP